MIKITATEGKIFRRISDGTLFGNEVYLGLAYPKDAEPYEELPEHFEEIDQPSRYARTLMRYANGYIAERKEVVFDA